MPCIHLATECYKHIIQVEHIASWFPCYEDENKTMSHNIVAGLSTGTSYKLQHFKIKNWYNGGLDLPDLFQMIMPGCPVF